MFAKPLTGAPRYILMKSFFLAISWSYLHDLSNTSLKRLKLLRGEIAFQKRLVFYRQRTNIKIFQFQRISNHKNFIPNISITLLQISLTLHEQATIGEKGSRERFWKNSPQFREIRLRVNLVMASFLCNNNSDVLINTLARSAGSTRCSQLGQKGQLFSYIINAH